MDVKAHRGTASKASLIRRYNVDKSFPLSLDLAEATFGKRVPSFLCLRLKYSYLNMACPLPLTSTPVLERKYREIVNVAQLKQVDSSRASIAAWMAP